MINKLTDYTELVMNKYQTGTDKGCDIGFKSLSDLVSIKPGYTTYILGFAAAGKTELHLEILMNLTKKYQWKHALLSPEIGAVEDVVSELISKHLRKPFYKSNPFAATEKEIYNAMAELSHYFFAMDSEREDYDIESFYEDCDKLEKDNKIKLNSTSLDPWNDLNEDLASYGGREDKYLTWALKKVRQNATITGRHNFVVTHAKDMPPIALKSKNGGDVFCTAIPTLGSFAGGQVWSRRAFNVMGLWRPESGAINPATSLPFGENEAVVLSLKSKPKGVGRKGKASLFYDWKTNRYYEEIEGERYYAFEYEEKYKNQNIGKIESSKLFDEIKIDQNIIMGNINTDPQELPF